MNVDFHLIRRVGTIEAHEENSRGVVLRSIGLREEIHLADLVAKLAKDTFTVNAGQGVHIEIGSGNVEIVIIFIMDKSRVTIGDII